MDMSLPTVSTPQTVARALTLTLSNSSNERQSAEALLLQLAQSDDVHASHLLQLAASRDPIVAPAAALRLKNLIRHSRVSPCPLSDNARHGIRAHILQALSLCRASAVEGILAETMHWLVLMDFPSRWPALLHDISQYLSSGEATRVHAALVALRQLVKAYEFKTRDPSRLSRNDLNDVGLSHPREPLETIAAACFPTLLMLYQHLDSIVASTTDTTTQNQNQQSASSQQQQQNTDKNQQNTDRDLASHAQRLIVKIFWSCTHFILPPCLAEGDALDGWMKALLTTMRRPCRYVPVNDPEELCEVPEWKTKKWIASVLNRFLKRYGSPKKVPVEEPWAHDIAARFKSSYAETATGVMLQVLLSSSSSPSSSSTPTGVSSATPSSSSTASSSASSPLDNQKIQLSRRVAHHALDYIEEAIETAQLWAVVKTRVDTLLTQVVFSYLCFSDADEELWVNDPPEYVRKQYDFTEDLTSPRMAASNLLTKMADLRSKRTILPFLQYLMTHVLEPYDRATPSSPERARLARLKVGAFAALAAVKVKLVSKRDLASSLMHVLQAHVLPDLSSEFGFLRSESAWLLGQIASCVWPEFSAMLGEQVLRGCVAMLEDPFVPVQASAAGALQFLMEQDGASALIEPVAPQLLERLLGLMDKMSDGYASLLPAVDKLVEQYPDKIMPVTMPLVRRLMAAFKHSADGLLRDDGGDDDDDELAFTAAQVLHLISSVLSAVGEWEQAARSDRAQMFRLLEEELAPLLDNMFLESHQVFVEELLDVLGIFIVQTGEANDGMYLSPFLLSLIPKMTNGFHRWAADYIEQMIDAIEGYVTFGMRQLLASLIEGTNSNDGSGTFVASAGANGLLCFISIIEKLWSDKFDHREALIGAKIAEWLILNLGKTVHDIHTENFEGESGVASKAKCKEGGGGGGDIVGETIGQQHTTENNNNNNSNNNNINSSNTAEQQQYQQTRRRPRIFIDSEKAMEKQRELVSRIAHGAAQRLLKCNNEDNLANDSNNNNLNNSNNANNNSTTTANNNNNDNNNNNINNNNPNPQNLNHLVNSNSHDTSPGGSGGSGGGNIFFSGNAEVMTLADRLFCVLMDCCYVDIDAVLSALGTQALMALIGQYTCDLDTSGRFERMYAKKSIVLGLCAVIGTPAVMPQSKPHVLKLILAVNAKLDATVTQRRQTAAAAAAAAAAVGGDGGGNDGGAHVIEISGSEGRKYLKENHEFMNGFSSGGGGTTSNSNNNNNDPATGTTLPSVNTIPSRIGGSKLSPFVLGSPAPSSSSSPPPSSATTTTTTSTQQLLQISGGGSMSDLEDDEDATNIHDDMNERLQHEHIANGFQSASPASARNKKLTSDTAVASTTASTTITNATLGLNLNTLGFTDPSNAAASAPAFYDFLDMAAAASGDDEDDEDIVGVGAHALDDVDEKAHVVNVVHAQITSPWFADVGERDRATLEAIAHEVQQQKQNCGAAGGGGNR